VEVAVLSPNLRDRSISYIHSSDRLLANQYTEGVTERPNAEYRDLFRGVAPIVPAGARGVARVSVDLPDTLVRPGERVWLRITPLADEVLLPGECSLGLSATSAEEALSEYLPDLHRIVRRAYAQCTEAHVYDSGRRVDEFALTRLINEYLALDPADPGINLIRDRVLRLRRPVELGRPGPPDAPEWAVWQHRLLEGYTEIAHWWIDHRQLPNGELNGYLEDDTELSCEWAFVPLATGDEKVRSALRLMGEAVWNVIGDGGYSQVTMDSEHAGEYAGLSQTFMMLLDYGNPLYVERCLTTSKNLEWWTLVNDRGERHFRSYLFNASRVDDSPGHDIDHACNAYAMKPAFYASWYSANPEPREWMVQWARGWARAAMSDQKGKPVGALPYDILGRTGEIAPYSERWNQSVYYRDGLDHVKDLLYGAWDWSGDPALVAPLAYQGATVNEPDAAWRIRSGDTTRDAAVIEAVEKMIADNNAAGDDPQPGSWSAYTMYSELRYYFAWWATRDLRYLTEGLKEQCRNLERMRWLITEAEPYTDRAYIPGDRLLPFTMLGGSGGEVRAIYPDFAVSWEGIGTDVATLVTERTDSDLTVLAYSFAAQPIGAALRVWSLPHGRYHVALGVDTDGDGIADADLVEDDRELWRYEAVPVRLAPGATTVITARRIEALDDTRLRADLAIGERDVVRAGEELVVTVHNIGAAGAPAGLRVVALDADGRELAAADLSAVPAPHACVPSTVTVRLPAGRARAVVLDPEERLPEITEVNNQAAAPH